MSNHAAPGQSDHVSADVRSTLTAELDHAEANLVRLTLEHEQLLTDPGVIQEDRDTSAQLVTEAQALVDRARVALQRLDAGSYGICAGCGVSIPAERLEALPDTDRCITCS